MQVYHTRHDHLNTRSHYSNYTQQRKDVRGVMSRKRRLLASEVGFSHVVLLKSIFQKGDLLIRLRHPMKETDIIVLTCFWYKCAKENQRGIRSTFHKHKHLALMHVNVTYKKHTRQTRRTSLNRTPRKRNRRKPQHCSRNSLGLHRRGSQRRRPR